MERDHRWVLRSQPPYSGPVYRHARRYDYGGTLSSEDDDDDGHSSPLKTSYYPPRSYQDEATSQDFHRGRMSNSFDYDAATVNYSAETGTGAGVSARSGGGVVDDLHENGRTSSKEPPWSSRYLTTLPTGQIVRTHNVPGGRFPTSLSRLPTIRGSPPRYRIVYSEDDWEGSLRDTEVSSSQPRLVQDLPQRAISASTHPSERPRYAALTKDTREEQCWQHITVNEQKSVAEARLLANALQLERKADTDDQCLANAFRHL
jgi:hypothetical protein